MEVNSKWSSFRRIYQEWKEKISTKTKNVFFTTLRVVGSNYSRKTNNVSCPENNREIFRKFRNFYIKAFFKR